MFSALLHAALVEALRKSLAVINPKVKGQWHSPMFALPFRQAWWDSPIHGDVNDSFSAYIGGGEL